MTTATTALPLEERVARVGPLLRTHAATAEAARRLTPEAMTALVDADLLRTWVPRAYGGAEMDPLPALQLFEELSRIDSAAGWTVAMCTTIATFGERFPEAGTAEMFAEPRAVCAGAWFPPGTAEPVPGGFRVTGQWAFGSACHYASWLTGQALVAEGGAPRLDPAGNPVAIIFFVRAAEAEILDTWHTLGMRGTGSHDFRVADVFVPERRCWTVGPVEPRNPAYAGALYRMGLWLVPLVNAAVALGIARAAVEDVLALAGAKTPSYTRTGLADKPTAQDRIARARAAVDAARSYVASTADAAWAYARSGPRVDVVHGIPLALAGSFAMDAACQAVDLVHAVAGATGIREEHRFQQYFRDVHTLSQHAFSSASRFESVGKLLLGRESDWPFYYL